MPDDANRIPIWIVQGPNLNLLGQRNPEVYGTVSLETLNERLAEQAGPLGFKLTFFQSNHEGDLIDILQMAILESRGLIINPGGLTHTSVALSDALEPYPHPCIEVHLSNIYRREEYRRHSYVSPRVTGVLCGFGPESYRMALDALKQLID